MTNPSRKTTNKRPSNNSPESTETDHQPQRKRPRTSNSSREETEGEAELGSTATKATQPPLPEEPPGRNPTTDRSLSPLGTDVPTSDTPASRRNFRDEPFVVELQQSQGVDSGENDVPAVNGSGGDTPPYSVDLRTKRDDNYASTGRNGEVPSYIRLVIRGEGTVSSFRRESALKSKEGKRGQEKSKSSSGILRLDWVWSSKEISNACMHILSDNGDRVLFHQDYSCGTAAARGTLPISEGQHFWEIKMDSPVYGTAMMLGIGTKQVDLYKYRHTFCNMLGNDSSLESCGLSYTGRFYQGGSQGKTYCNKFGQGTVIGLHLDMWLGTLTFYKDGECLGVATKGLRGKVWHPMVSSTAAKSSMSLQNACSFPSSLQFWCCRALRQAIPAEHNVLDVLEFPPGMRTFLQDNLLWLLDSQSCGDVDVTTKGTQTNLSMATHQLSNVPVISVSESTSSQS